MSPLRLKVGGHVSPAPMGAPPTAVMFMTVEFFSPATRRDKQFHDAS